MGFTRYAIVYLLSGIDALGMAMFIGAGATDMGITAACFGMHHGTGWAPRGSRSCSGAGGCARAGPLTPRGGGSFAIAVIVAMQTTFGLFQPIRQQHDAASFRKRRLGLPLMMFLGERTNSTTIEEDECRASRG